MTAATLVAVARRGQPSPFIAIPYDSRFGDHAERRSLGEAVQRSVRRVTFTITQYLGARLGALV
jgi:hypothetical protein